MNSETRGDWAESKGLMTPTGLQEESAKPECLERGSHWICVCWMNRQTRGQQFRSLLQHSLCDFNQVVGTLQTQCYPQETGGYTLPSLGLFLGQTKEKKASDSLYQKSLLRGTHFHLSACTPFPLPTPAMSLTHNLYWQNLSKKTQTLLNIPTPDKM